MWSTTLEGRAPLEGSDDARQNAASLIGEQRGLEAASECLIGETEALEEKSEAVSEYTEILAYLRDKRKEVRKQAAELVSGTCEEPRLVSAFVRNVREESEALLRVAVEDADSSAASALVNLSADKRVAEALGDMKHLTTIFEWLSEKHLLGPASVETLALMILTNVTREENGRQNVIARDVFLIRLLQYWGASLRSQVPESLTELECDLPTGPSTPTSLEAGADRDSTSEKHLQTQDRCVYVGNILVNLTKCAAGRKWFAEESNAEDWHVFQKCLSNSLRRQAVLHLLKNLCTDQEILVKLIEKQVPLLETLAIVVYPHTLPAETPSFAASEEKAATGEKSVWTSAEATREVDAAIKRHCMGPVRESSSRLTVAETFTLILRDENAREKARALNMYEVLRAWHSIETDEAVLTAIEDIVHLTHYTEEELKQQDAELQQAAQNVV